ncbi:MAG TPA: DNA-processing protein DprA [Candidatus Limnocylindria bacterium]|nr:DNA-processing protein DprA [Candidatus Limnocylindria bacterium]
MIALAADDERYPPCLRDLPRPPDPLWVDGDASSLRAPAVAIVGTRRMTGYGERVARELAMACASAGLVVVSGLAQGIDTAAHRGALDAGGRTVAVLGESIPSFIATISGRRRPLVPRIRASGALASEFAAPFTARTWTFAQRNATIAALSSVTVVVEAGETSGALITAEDARRLGRALYAVPGPLGSAASVGTNALIAQRLARALVSADQLVRAAGVRLAATPNAARSDALLDALRDGPLGLDELARRLRVPSTALSPRVATLLLSGEIATLPDGRLRRSP